MHTIASAGLERHGFEVRRPEVGWSEVGEVAGQAFGGLPPDVSEHYGRLHENERSVGAYDGTSLVGHVGVLSLRMRLPGAEGPVAGVTMCAVRPTHRRRGILSTLMRRQLEIAHETGAEPVSMLSATEAAIYGRFGYGRASDQLAVELPRAAVLRDSALVGEREVAIRWVDPVESAAACGAIHDAATANRPGSFRYSPVWTELAAHPPETMLPGIPKLRCVLAETEAGVNGYAYFTIAPDPADSAGTVHVDRVYSTDVKSYLALWRFLLDLDLTATVRHPGLAVDDPLLESLVDIRRAKARLVDGLWVRLVDVDRALAARTYGTPVDVVIEVRDDICPWNARRWRLSADPGGASCESTTDEPDLRMDVRDLGAGYLGRPLFATLVAAGIAEEFTRGAAVTADRAFAHSPLPYRDTIFKGTIY